MADSAYKLVWSAEVTEQLRSGMATLARDRAGILLPIARDTRSIVGLPRIIESIPQRSAATLLAPIVAGANLVATAFNIWQIRRLRSDITEELQMSRAMLTDAVEREGTTTRQTLLLSVESIREDIKRLEDLDLRKALNRLVAAREIVASWKPNSAPQHELHATAERLHNEVIPTLLSHYQGAKSLGDELRLGLFVVGAYGTLGSAYAMATRLDRAAAAYENASTIASDQARRLVLTEGSAFDFFTSLLPAARIMLAAHHSMRISELAMEPARFELSPTGSSAIVGLAEESDTLAMSEDLTWPEPLPESVGSTSTGWRRTNMSGPLVARITGRPVLLERSALTFEALGQVVGASSHLPVALTNEQANLLGPRLTAMADPANRDIERDLLLDALCDVRNRMDLVREAADTMKSSFELEVEPDELISMSLRSLLTIIHRARRAPK